MTDEEKFRFDLQGYLIIKGVLSRRECGELSDLADVAWPEQQEDGPNRRDAFASLWHERFLDLVDHQLVGAGQL